jgi:hypothetical protein
MTILVKKLTIRDRVIDSQKMRRGFLDSAENHTIQEKQILYPVFILSKSIVVWVIVAFMSRSSVIIEVIRHMHINARVHSTNQLK